MIWFLFHLISHSIYSSISWQEHITFPLNYDDVYFMLDQLAGFDFYSAITLAQQSTNRHMASLGQNSLTPTSLSCVLSVETSNSNIIVFRTYSLMLCCVLPIPVHYDKIHYEQNMVNRTVFITLNVYWSTILKYIGYPHSSIDLSI